MSTTRWSKAGRAVTRRHKGLHTLPHATRADGIWMVTRLRVRMYSPFPRFFCSFCRFLGQLPEPLTSSILNQKHFYKSPIKVRNVMNRSTFTESSCVARVVHKFGLKVAKRPRPNFSRKLENFFPTSKVDSNSIFNQIR